ncbi:fungal hydrophobin-domain-containing protein [Schizophyllum commune]|nr:fungal hydrophobin [Schizophyllum commune Loenen D]
MRFFSTLVLALPALAMATAVPRDVNGGTPPKSCSSGPVYCCNKTEDSKHLDKGATALLGLLNIKIGNLKDLVGFNCSPLSVIGVGGNSCSAQTVCCTNTYQHGLVNVGCTPINIGL